MTTCLYCTFFIRKKKKVGGGTSQRQIRLFFLVLTQILYEVVHLSYEIFAGVSSEQMRERDNRDKRGGTQDSRTQYKILYICAEKGARVGD